MVELLDAEIIDTTFSILGPGWVKTKIHDSTLKAGNAAGKNYEKTIQMLENNGSECYPMEKLLIVVIGYYHLPESWWVEEILVPFMIHGKVIK